MVNFSAATRVFVAVQPVDLRGGFNRLFALTQSVLQQDPLSGHWFVFTNRLRNRLKILFWDGSGTGNIFRGNVCQTSSPTGLCD